MTPERWQQVRDLYERIVGLDSAVRSDALHAACANDVTLRRIVERMLASLDAPDTWLERLVREGSDAIDQSDFDSVVERDHDEVLPVIDRYRIERRLGDGGMGIVYAARRSDGVLTTPVAIKVLRRGLDSDLFLQRFRAERGALERLDHPNIARLIDAGTCGDGRPFLVMELVEGERIDQWSAERASVPEIVSLFLNVCDAVAYAHSRLVIHRDIKPSNVLVSAEGTAKLLDFGIAKILDDGANDPAATRTGDRILTPRYASPEHLRGEPVSTASDVYALGVLLFEMLTRSSPYVINEHSVAAYCTALREQSPQRASEATLKGNRSPRQATTVARALRGDLDTILDKALRADPARRYQTVTVFANDLRAVLDSRPISARPESLGYELRKLVGRHPRQSIAAALAVACITALSIISVVSTNRAQASEKAASEALTSSQTHEAIASRYGEFLTEEFLLLLDPARSMNGAITLEEAIRQAAGRVEGRFPESPLAEALIEHTIGDAFIQRTRYAEAEPHLRRASKLREKHLGSDHLDTLIAQRDLATSLFFLNRLDEARSHLESVVATQTRTLSSDDGLTLLSKSILARVLAGLGDDEQAERMFRETYDGRMKVLGAKDGNTQSSMNQLGVFLMQRGRYDDALPLFVQAEELRRAEFGDDHPRTLIARANLATLQYRLGDSEKGLRELEAVRAVQLRVLGPTHGHTAHVLTLIAEIYATRGEHDKALAAHQSRIEALTTLHGAEALQVCDVRLTVAEILLAQKRLEEASAEAATIRTHVTDHIDRGTAVPDTMVERLDTLDERLREQAATPVARMP